MKQPEEGDDWRILHGTESGRNHVDSDYRRHNPTHMPPKYAGDSREGYERYYEQVPEGAERVRRALALAATEEQRYHHSTQAPKHRSFTRPAAGGLTPHIARFMPQGGRAPVGRSAPRNSTQPAPERGHTAEDREGEHTDHKEYDPEPEPRGTTPRRPER